MKKILFITAILFIGLPIFAKADIDAIVGLITKNQLRKYPHIYIFALKNNVPFSKYIRYNPQNDTIFVRENVASAYTYGPVMMWNKADTVTVYFSETEYKVMRGASNYSMPRNNAELELINDWDTAKLTKPHNKGYVMSRNIKYYEYGDSFVYTTRIIIHNGYSSFETIMYPFFNTRFLEK